MSVKLPDNMIINEFTNSSKHKYNKKIREILYGLTMSVQEYIFDENDGASKEYKQDVRSILTQTMDTYLAGLNKIDRK